MDLLNSVMVIVSWAILFLVLMRFPKSKEQQNGMLWVPLSFLLCECVFAAFAGIFSLLHIAVNPISIGTASLSVAAVLIIYTYKAGRRQEYYWKKGDIAVAGAIAAFAVWFFIYRFGGEYIIAYSTNDSTDRISAAMHIVTEQSAIYTWPNLYFGHTANALFIEALGPFYPGNLFFRAYQIKDVINLAIGGLLFHAALRQYSDRGIPRIAFAILTFLYITAFPLSGALFGFNYLGISINLIIMIQVAIHMLIKADVEPRVALVLISLGCFGVGASYTLFAPPAFIAAFIAIAYYTLRVRRSKQDFFKIQLGVFVWPAILTFIYTVLLDPAGQRAIGDQLAFGGAIYVGFFTEVIPYLPFIIFAVWALFKRNRKKKGVKNECGNAIVTMVQPIAFFAIHMVFLVRMLMGITSDYYFAKFNYVTWFFLLLIAGVGIVFICEKYPAERIEKSFIIYTVCFAILAAFAIPAETRALKDFEPQRPFASILSSPFRIYADNLYRFSDADMFRNYYDAHFVYLISAAWQIKQQQGITSFYVNMVEAITDDFSAKYWVDALSNEQITVEQINPAFDEFRPGEKSLPGGNASIWIVFRNSMTYITNREHLDSFPKIYENALGFVIVID